MLKLFEDQDISNFLTTNKLSHKEAGKFLSELKLYQADKDKYRLDYHQQMIILTELNHDLNPGLEFLEQTIFGHPIKLDDVDYALNPSKSHFLKAAVTNTGKGYYLCGNNGVGKTMLAVALANTFYDQKHEQTLFVFWPDFIEKTKRFGDDNVYYINKVKHAPRLIIDDIGQESISNWSRDDILNSIIAFRLEKKLYTLITSNYHQKELLDLYTLRTIDQKKAKAIVNKISALCPEMIIQGKDYRVNK